LPATYGNANVAAYLPTYSGNLVATELANGTSTVHMDTANGNVDITVTGTNSLIGTSSPPFSAYTAGMTLSFVPVATNTGAVTIDLDGLGAKNVTFDASTVLTADALAVGKIATLEYDGTRFQLINSVNTGQIVNGAVTAAKLATDSVTTIKILDANVTAAKLATNSVTTIKITDANVTPAKLSTGAPSWDAAGVFTMNSGYGSNAAAYGCRAWVNFNGTGTVAIRASGNVSSITDNGTGDYTVNFTTAMPDADYAITGTASRAGTTTQAGAGVTVTPNDVVTARTSSACRIILLVNNGDGSYDIAVDSAQVNIAIFR
jgi:hypothetical protein